MLPEIKTLWIGGDLSRLERVCLASFIAHGHKVTLYTYGDVGNIPKGVVLEDANKIIDSSKVFNTERQQEMEKEVMQDLLIIFVIKCYMKMKILIG